MLLSHHGILKTAGGLTGWHYASDVYEAIDDGKFTGNNFDGISSLNDYNSWAYKAGVTEVRCSANGANAWTGLQIGSGLADARSLDFSVFSTGCWELGVVKVTWVNAASSIQLIGGVYKYYKGEILKYTSLRGDAASVTHGYVTSKKAGQIIYSPEWYFG